MYSNRHEKEPKILGIIPEKISVLPKSRFLTNESSKKRYYFLAEVSATPNPIARLKKNNGVPRKAPNIGSTKASPSPMTGINSYILFTEL